MAHKNKVTQLNPFSNHNYNAITFWCQNVIHLIHQNIYQKPNNIYRALFHLSDLIHKISRPYLCSFRPKEITPVLVFVYFGFFFLLKTINKLFHLE